MTTVDSPIPTSPPNEAGDVPRGIWNWIEGRLERAGEWLNPILVKEARQALKSKQFGITFTLLLVFGWGWSLFGVAVFMSGNSHVPAGTAMLAGYYWILAFPLFVIVPFSAFRSLAAEREDGTFELLSITTLKARQIVSGKLGSAILQMIVYYSALSPCIAFTYLLRGIDIITIVLLLSITFLLSVLLSVAGLFLATVSRQKHWQIVLSVVTILGLAWIFFAVSSSVHQRLQYGMLYDDDPEFWSGLVMTVSSVCSYGVLFFFAAGAAISFPSENRSTKLRVIMFLQQALLMGWLVWAWVTQGDAEWFYFSLIIALVHWAVMGALMVGESNVLSQRVTRGLPQTVIGRMYLSWLIPGPGTGYMFTLVNMLGVCLCCFAVLFVGQVVFDVNRDLPDAWALLTFSFLACCYLATYLGLSKLFVAIARPFARTSPFLSLVTTTLLVVLGSFGALALQFSFVDYYRQDGYTLWQVANPFWTLFEVIDWDVGRGAFAQHVLPVCLLVGAFSAFIFAVNLLLSTDEFRRERQAAPQRVLEDEMELHPQRHASPLTPKNPFEDA